MIYSLKMYGSVYTSFSISLIALVLCIGHALAGPTLAGPTLAGPTIVGPTLVGPALVGPALIGPALAGRSGCTPFLISLSHRVYGSYLHRFVFTVASVAASQRSVPDFFGCDIVTCTCPFYLPVLPYTRSSTCDVTLRLSRQTFCGCGLVLSWALDL
jgi:hypothetical protein